MEDFAAEGFDLDVPRFHLVPLELYPALPTIRSLALRGGLVYMPTVFIASMRRFGHLSRLFLHQTIFLSAHDLRRMLESLRQLKILALDTLRWVPHNPGHPVSSSPRQPRSRLRLESLQVIVHAEWIADARSTAFLDWLSTSGAISGIHHLRLEGLMLIDKNITAAVSGMVCAVQKSTKLSSLAILFGPDVDWTPCKFPPSPYCFASDRAVLSVHAPLASLPQLQHLHINCPYDTASLAQLAHCLSATLARPEDTMHSELYLHFDRYLPDHAAEPPPECWERLDSALQFDGIPEVNVDRSLRQCDPDKPVIWGDYYRTERSDEWLSEARKRFPKVCESGRLWAADAHGAWRRIQCEFSLLL